MNFKKSNNWFKLIGSFGGGLKLTLYGSGFDSMNSTVKICNDTCAIQTPRSSAQIDFTVILE